jgi:FimV-like protein
VEHYDKALQSEPNNSTVRINLARALAGSGDLPKARDAYLECLKLDTSNWDARLELGKTYISLEDSDSAKRSLQELIRGNPNYTGRAEAERILSGL